MTDLKNCPNCGAPIQDYICDYCGTVFPSNINDFNGRKAIIIAIDEKDRLLIHSINISSIEENRNYDNIFTTNELRLYSPMFPQISIEGSSYDNTAIMHQMQELKRILNKRL